MTLADPLAPPTEVEAHEAAARFADSIARAYGDALRGIYLFGSRARGDHQPHSDVDLAVVVDDADWSFWEQKIRLSDIAYDIVAATGVAVQGWPVRESEWRDPDSHRNPSLVRAMKRDGQPLGRQ